MTSPFLEYELLTPETADPVVIRITGQRVRYFLPFKASNGVVIGVSRSAPQYFSQGEPSPLLLVWSIEQRIQGDSQTVPLPLSDWPAVKQAIGELNEHYKEKGQEDRIDDTMNALNALLTGRKIKEKDMNFKKIDEYNRMVRDIAALVEPAGYDLLVNPDATLTVTRKKPKVDGWENTPVKVEWRKERSFRLGAGWEYGWYSLVQFRVTGETWQVFVKLYPTCGEIDLTRPTEFKDNPCKTGYSRITIGLDAQSKWSAPVLLPESVYSRLDEITKALEDRANGVKG